MVYMVDSNLKTTYHTLATLCHHAVTTKLPLYSTNRQTCQYCFGFEKLHTCTRNPTNTLHILIIVELQQP